MSNLIFVFGSNEAGVHGAGAALYAAKNYGAVYREGIGRTGNAYAIPTKDADIETLPLSKIYMYILDFLDYAENHPELDFMVTRIGCGLAGFKDEDIAILFADAPDNCQFDRAWELYLSKDRSFWGTF